MNWNPRQLFCGHKARKTTFQIHINEVRSRTVCSNCGACVRPYNEPAVQQRGYQLLYRHELFGNADNKGFIESGPYENVFSVYDC